MIAANGPKGPSTTAQTVEFLLQKDTNFLPLGATWEVVRFRHKCTVAKGGEFTLMPTTNWSSRTQAGMLSTQDEP